MIMKSRDHQDSSHSGLAGYSSTFSQVFAVVFADQLTFVYGFNGNYFRTNGFNELHLLAPKVVGILFDDKDANLTVQSMHSGAKFA